MDKRMVNFIRALRAAGVRISLAESLDALNGVQQVGIGERDFFRAAMKTTLVKEARDQGKFEQYFPLFFGANRPPMEDILDNLTPEQQQQLQQALEALQGSPQALRDLLRQLLEGRPFDQDQLDQAGQQAGLSSADDMNQRRWFERRVERQMNMQQLQQAIEELLEMLAQMGMSREDLQQLREMLEQNAQGLSDQVSNFVGANIAERMAEKEPEPKPDLMDVPFSRLSDDDVEAIRDEIRRLAAKLRSRAALRQRRDRTGTLDPRKTMRANMRYGGVPMELKFQTHHVKPCLVLICDVSTSMRHCAEFLLTLIYELQDQVAKTDSFIFISDLTDISMTFSELEPMAAVEKVLNDNRPGYYNTDLGNSLNTFQRDHIGKVTSRTTVVILGDGRNNYNNPRLDVISDMMRKSRRLLWFNPEPPSQWGTGDSDMLQYAPLSHGVYKVSNLRELAAAVDKILADG
ncbi:MAG: VWA domain-containing protein [Anaerolineae bacterium]|nr:VWA domain-containing protein [Anaerolineae bacterium]